MVTAPYSMLLFTIMQNYYISNSMIFHTKKGIATTTLVATSPSTKSYINIC